MADWVPGWEAMNSLPGYILCGLLLSAAMYAFLGKKDELSLPALANMATSAAIAMANLGVWVLFASVLAQFAGQAFGTLNIPTLDPEIWDKVPVWLGVLAVLLAKDFVDYWNHRLMHSTWLGWLCHMAHHSDTHVNPLSAFRTHILENLLMSVSYALLLTWMQLPELAPMVVFAAYLHSMYVHMNLDIDHGRLKYVIASPTYHRWHHADVPDAYGKNLANIFPFYDVIFGTYYAPGPCRAEMGAKATGVDGTDFMGIYLYPAREIWRRLRKHAGRKKAALPGRG